MEREEAIKLQKEFYDKKSPSTIVMFYFVREDDTIHVRCTTIYWNNLDSFIKNLSKIDSSDGFMFFADSDDGKKWLEENKNAIKTSLYEYVINNMSLSFD